MTIAREVDDRPVLAKSPTGIGGLDEATGGGLPEGRPTLVCGGPGCGKTLLAMEFLVRGATEFGEPGVFVAFEETPEELGENAGPLGFDLASLEEQRKLVVDHVHIDRHDAEEVGEYDLEGLFLRLGGAIDAVGAKRVVLDTIETLFSGFSDPTLVRLELRRLFRWLKERGVTVVITGERGSGELTRHGLEEYVSDCVILLDHRVTGQVSTRLLRIVKYRGSTHGTNEYPFLIEEDGITVLPITSLGLDHDVSTERISSGIPRLDTMLGGEGFFRGSSVLITGTAGTGKTSLAATFVDAACRSGERCLYFAFEESPNQLMRNLSSIGLDLRTWVDRGLLRFHAARPTLHGLEMHLATMHKQVREFRPGVVVIDPISNFTSAGTVEQAGSMLMRLVDFLKSGQITALFTNLTTGGAPAEQTDIGISSLIDTWLLLRDIELYGERNRGLYILKSRGMAHSNQIREMLLTKQGVELTDVYLGPEGVLTGSARLVQESREVAAAVLREQEMERRRRTLSRRRKALEAQIAALQSELGAEEDEVEQLRAEEDLRRSSTERERREMARSRKADDAPSVGGRDGPGGIR